MLKKNFEPEQRKSHVLLNLNRSVPLLPYNGKVTYQLACSLDKWSTVTYQIPPVIEIFARSTYFLILSIKKSDPNIKKVSLLIKQAVMCEARPRDNYKSL